MRPVSKVSQSQILELARQGSSTSKIATQVGVSHQTVNRIRAEHLPGSVLPRAGRPQTLSACSKRALV
jgi:transposase-like protein